MQVKICHDRPWQRQRNLGNLAKIWLYRGLHNRDFLVVVVVVVVLVVVVVVFACMLLLEPAGLDSRKVIMPFPRWRHFITAGGCN